MKQFLTKAVEVLRRLFRATVEFIRWVIALLQSVNIDQPRGVILCLGLQLVTIVVFLVAFRRDTESPSRPVPVQVVPASPDSASPVGGQEPLSVQ
jgi:hypothetical protein